MFRLLLFRNYLFIKGIMTKAFEFPTQKFVICKKHFVSIFQYFLFYYFRFSKLYYVRNYFIITCKFNDFIHELIFLLFELIQKCLGCSKRAFVWIIIVSSSFFYLSKWTRCILFSFLLLMTLLLLFTEQLFNKRLGLLAFLSFHVS